MAYNLYKHPKYGMVYGESLITPPVRCCWVHLKTARPAPPPKEGEEAGAPRFEINLLFPKADKAAINFLKSIKEMAGPMLELFNQKRAAKLTLSRMVQDGDDADYFDMEKYDFVKGNYVLTARNTQDPKLINTEKEVISPECIVGGNIVCCAIQPMLTAHGLSYKLKIAQLVEDDEVRYGARGDDALLEMMTVLSKPKAKKEEVTDFAGFMDSSDTSDASEQEEAPKKRGRRSATKAPDVTNFAKNEIVPATPDDPMSLALGDL